MLHLYHLLPKFGMYPSPCGAIMASVQLRLPEDVLVLLSGSSSGFHLTQDTDGPVLRTPTAEADVDLLITLITKGPNIL